MAIPTRAAPGSVRKIDSLAERAALGLPLFAADDATFATAEAGSAPERLRELTPKAARPATRPATITPSPVALEVTPTPDAEGGRPVPGLTLHRGVRVWRVAFKNRGRRVVVYFGRSWEAASARYREWASTWPAPLLADVPPVRDRARLIDTPTGPVRLTEAARAAGIRPGTLAYRLDVLGWSVADALARPTRRHEVQEPSLSTQGEKSCQAA